MLNNFKLKPFFDQQSFLKRPADSPRKSTLILTSVMWPESWRESIL